MRKRLDRMHNIIYCQRFSAILESHFHFHNSLNFDRFFLCEFCPKHLLKHFIESKTIFGKSRTSTCIYIYILPCFNREQNSSSQTQKLINYFYKKTKLWQEKYTIAFVINQTFIHTISYQRQNHGNKRQYLNIYFNVVLTLVS